MNEPRIPKEILDLLDAPAHEVEARSREVRGLRERFPEFRGALDDYLFVVERLRRAREESGDEAGAGAGAAALPPDLERSLLEGVRPLLGRRGVAGTRRRRLLLAVTALAAAAVLLGLLGIRLLLPRGGEAGPAIAAEVRRVALRSREVRLYFEITPASPCYLSIVGLDPERSAEFVFPLGAGTGGGAGARDFGLSGPFPAGRELRIPPGEGRGFSVTSESGTEHFFFLPTASPLDAGARSEILAAVRDVVRAAAAEDLRNVAGRVESLLRERFPGTLHRSWSHPEGAGR